MMNFFEAELRKIVGSVYPDATYVGRACYVRLSAMNRAKLDFVTCGMAGQYEALQMTILNCMDGKVDALRLRFSDLWGGGQKDNRHNRQYSFYAWTDNGQTDWYSFEPGIADYEKLTKVVSEYLEVFQEQTQTAAQQWQQTM